MGLKNTHAPHVRFSGAFFKSIESKALSHLVWLAEVAYSADMSLRKNLLLVPSNRLDAFTATGVLADMLKAEPSVEVEIICRESDVVYFENAPGRMSFITHNKDVPPRFSLMLKTLGRTWHRIVSLTNLRLPFLLWAQHRHSFKFTAGAYALPSLFRPDRATPPHIWGPEKIHLPLPETLTPLTPLVVFATQESGRADWDWRHYAELAWRLADSVPQLANAHIVVLSSKDCRVAQGLVDNLPAGQITCLPDLPYAKTAALLRRAKMVLGTDRLVARMAPYASCGLVLRLDRAETLETGRPYGLYTGHDAGQVASYIGGALPKVPMEPKASIEPKAAAAKMATQDENIATVARPLASQSKAELQALADQINRINNDR